MKRIPDTGSSYQAPFATKASPAQGTAARRAFEDTIQGSNPRMIVDMILEFAGKFASGFGGNIATRTTGTPTGVAQVANTANGEIAMTLAATNEAEFAGIDWTDQLQIPATALPVFEAYVKTPAAALTSVQDIVIGLATAYNSTLNSISKYVRFRLSGSNALLIEGKDGTTTSNANDVGMTLTAATYYLFTIRLDRGNGKWLFFVDDNFVGSLSLAAFAATDLLQPLVGIRKASGTGVPALTADYLRLQWYRVL